MDIIKTQEGGKITLNLEGRLDTTTSSQLQDSLIPSIDEAKDVILDFSKLAYVSSAGLRVLLAAQKNAKAKGVSMKILGVSPDVMEIFDMTGFSDILTIE